MKMVGVTVIVKDGKEALLQHRDNIPGLIHAGMWCIPGGKIESGEEAEQAARREIVEETGYKAGEMRYVTSYRVKLEGFEEAEVKVFTTVYDNRQEIQCFEGQEMRWVGREELQKLNVVEGQGEIVLGLLKS